MKVAIEMSKVKFSVIIPAYNEAEVINGTINEITNILNRLVIESYEIIVIDDHSTDNTFDIVKNIADSKIKSIRLSRRCGSHTAIRAGLIEAIGDAVLCLSADGQDDPVYLRGMLEKWRNGAKVVWALRESRFREPWYIRKSAQAFYKLLIWLGGAGGTDIDISRANFCLLDRIVVDAINKCLERNTSLFGLILWLGFNQDSVEYQRRIRKFGASKWNFWSQLRLAKDWIKGFSGLPLTLIFIVGILVTTLGFFYAIYVLIDIILGKSTQGQSLIMVAILLIGGVQMIMLGIIGDYLWSNLDEGRHRPLFFIEKRSDKPADV